jgi:hypothetical protein
MPGTPPPSGGPADPAQPPAAGKAQRRLAGLRRTSAGISVMLLIQYGLGMGVNLYLQVPRADQGSGAVTALGRALTSQPAALAAHAAFGLLLVIAAINVLAGAIRARRALAIAASAAGLAAILAAGASGTNFASNGQAGASMAMAILTSAALACYLLILAVTGDATQTPPPWPRHLPARLSRYLTAEVTYDSERDRKTS